MLRFLKLNPLFFFITLLLSFFMFLKFIYLAKKIRFSVIIVRDLPLSGLAIVVGRLLRIRVIFDMAENYPAALIVYNKVFYKPCLNYLELSD
jgi:hypothetical protein